MEKNNSKLNVVSSFVLRGGRNKEDRTVDECISYKCSICGKKHILGKTSFAIFKVSYVFGNELVKLTLCGVCTDLLVDLLRYGPRVINEAYKWVIKSKVIRLSLVNDTLYCSTCLKVSDSHLFVKYDDLIKVGKHNQSVNKRVCAKCIISYLNILKTIDFKTCSFNYLTPLDNIDYSNKVKNYD